MQTAHFQTVLSHGQVQANQIAELVEQRVEEKPQQIPSEAYAEVYQELSAKYISATGKSLAADDSGSRDKADRKE